MTAYIKSTKKNKILQGISILGVLVMVSPIFLDIHVWLFFGLGVAIAIISTAMLETEEEEEISEIH